MKHVRIASFIVGGLLMVGYSASWAQVLEDRPLSKGRQLKRGEMIGEMKRIYGPLVPDDEERFKNAPLQIRPDPDAEFEEILQVNPADPPIYWLRKPEDERPLFTTLPYSEIELVRRLYRHASILLALPGVWGLGMSEKGFHINLDPAKGDPLLPATLENIPIIVEKSAMPVAANHLGLYKRPIGAGLSVGRNRWLHPPNAVFRGSLGPFVVYDVPQVPQCCQIFHTTAGPAIKHQWEPFPPNDSPGAPAQVRQPWNGNPTNLWYVIGWQQIPVQTNPNFTNNVAVQPDLAIFAHNNPPQQDGNWPAQGYTPSCLVTDSNTAPVRKVYFGPSSRVDGPEGGLMPLGITTDLKIFGAESAHASIARIQPAQYNIILTYSEADNDTQTPPHTCGGVTCTYRAFPFHQFRITSGGVIQPGDSGAIVWRRDKRTLLESVREV